MTYHPFPKIARLPRLPENKRLHDELAAYLVSVATHTKRMPMDEYGNKYRPTKTRNHTDKA